MSTRPGLEHCDADTGELVVGREAELSSLEQFIDQVRSGPGALLIQGDPGAGKTTLWRAATTSARRRGYRVLACHPAEPEASMPFAALGDLLAEALTSGGQALPEHQLRALRVAVLLDSAHGPAPDIRTVAMATLGLLRQLAAEAPVLVAVDDYQWADAGTTGVIEYILRRVRDEPIGFIATASGSRPTPVPTTLDRDLVERQPNRVVAGPLSVTALDELIRARLGAGLPLPVLQEVARASAGNALFALEIARAVDLGEIELRPGEPLAVPRTLGHLVGRRFDGLSHDLQEMLAVASATPDPTVALVQEVSGSRSARARLDSAVAAGIITLDGELIRFAHPLFSSVLYHRVPPGRRALLHERLAASVASTPDRARHLALAATKPDETVAAVLDEAAAAAAARGDRATAARLSDEAARLTPRHDVAARERRRLRAADEAFAAGDARRARAILEDLAMIAEAGPHRADLLRRLAEVRYRSDSVAVAASLLSRAASEAGPRGALRARIERDLAWAVSLCGDVRDAAAHATLALELAREEGDEGLVRELSAASILTDWLRGHTDDRVRDAPDLADLLTDASVPVEWRPATILGVLTKWSDDLGTAESVLRDLQQSALASGDETSLPFLLAQLGEVAVLRGDPRGGLQHGQESAALARQMGQEAVLGGALYTVALAQAHLGLTAEARSTATDALEVAQAAGSVISMMLAQSVLGGLELASGDAAAASQSLRPLLAWAEVVGVREPGVIRFVPDAAEAMIATGAPEAADAALREFERDAERLRRPTARLAAARARAIHTASVGNVAEGVLALEQALDRDRTRAQPLELGRALFALGGLLRRTRRRRAAIDALEAALTAFERVGASEWAHRASVLMSSGSNGHSTNGKGSLTPAEQRVSSLVAHGHSNRAVADQLFVSVRAVEVHLTSIYRKLGIASRTQLAARLAAGDPVVPTDDGTGSQDANGLGDSHDPGEAGATLPSPAERTR